jgi:hypothetical protein
MVIGLVSLLGALQRQLALGGNPFRELIFSPTRANRFRLKEASFPYKVLPVDRSAILKTSHVLISTYRLLHRSLMEDTIGTGDIVAWSLRENAACFGTFSTPTRGCLRAKATNYDQRQNESIPATSRKRGCGRYERTIRITGRKDLFHDVTSEIRSKKSMHLAQRPEPGE